MIKLNKNQKKVLIVLIVFTIITIPLIAFIRFTGFYLVNGNGGSLPPPFDEIPSTPKLYTIQPDPDVDGIINLDWSDSERVVYYNVWRRSGGVDVKIANVLITSSYVDSDTKEDGEIYYYRVVAKNSIGVAWSNEESVVIDIPSLPEPVYPSNPSIDINNGNESTDSFDLIFTLYCENALEMHFQIYLDVWTNWIPYTATYCLIMSKEYVTPTGTFKIEAVFRNNDGTTKDADPNRVVSDDIIYNAPGIPEEPEEPEEPYNYTLVSILLGVLGALIGVIIYLKYRKKQSNVVENRL